MFGSVDKQDTTFGAVECLLALAALALFALLAAVAVTLPLDETGLAQAAEEALPQSGLGNSVNAVLLDFRAFDTLLEKAVLLVALVGLWGLLPGVEWALPSGNFLTPGPPEPQLGLLLRVLAPLGLLSSIYLLWLGAEEAGGAFQAGTIIAAVLILLVLGKAVNPPGHGGPWLRCGALAGFLVFAGVGLSLLAFGRPFLDYPADWAKTLILLIEVAVAASVALILYLLGSGLPRFPGERP